MSRRGMVVFIASMAVAVGCEMFLFVAYGPAATIVAYVAVCCVLLATAAAESGKADQ